MESMFSIAFAIAIAFVFSWQMALIALGLMPIMLIGSAVSAKQKTVQYNGLGENEDQNKSEADLLAADAIQNYKTV